MGPEWSAWRGRGIKMGAEMRVWKSCESDRGLARRRLPLKRHGKRVIDRTMEQRLFGRNERGIDGYGIRIVDNEEKGGAIWREAGDEGGMVRAVSGGVMGSGWWRNGDE